MGMSYEMEKKDCTNLSWKPFFNADTDNDDDDENDNADDDDDENDNSENIPPNYDDMLKSDHGQIFKSIDRMRPVQNNVQVDPFLLATTLMTYHQARTFLPSLSIPSYSSTYLTEITVVIRAIKLFAQQQQ